MDLLLAIILGIVQGITEWLPVSSSGHLVLLQQVFGGGNSVIYDIMVHGGTLLAVVVYFWKDFIGMLRDVVMSFIEFPKKRGGAFRERRFTWYVLLATIPIAIVGVLLNDYIEDVFSNLLVVGISFIVTGFWLLSTRWARPGKDVNLGRSFTVGLAQAVAILPGISRSGSTIATGMLLGFSREDAARFSFLLSIPTIGGAFLYKVLSTPMENVLTAPNIAGLITSFVVGVLTIKFLLYVIKRGRFYAFAFYTIPLGILTLVYYFLT